MTHPLDAPAWWAVLDADGSLVRRLGRAGRYRADVTVFAGYDPDTDGADLVELMGADDSVALVGQAVPSGLERTWQGEAHQMVLPPGVPAGRRSVPAHGYEVHELGEADVDDMLSLVGRARPGPFAERTVHLGTYLGVRHRGRLVAMAGQRFRTAGHVEISAVCTDPDVRRAGLASALVRRLVEHIRAEGATPFLHVATTNLTAVPVYTGLGFVERRRIPILGARRAPS